MAKPGKRAPLNNIGGMLQKKPAQAATAREADDAGEVKRDAAGRRNRQPDGRKGILVRARPDAWKALKHIALNEERTLQDLMTEAINDCLAKHGHPPIA